MAIVAKPKTPPPKKKDQDQNIRNTMVIVRDLATGGERRRFRIDPFSTLSVATVLGLTPDGKQILGAFGQGVDGGQHGDVARFSLETGKEVARLKTGLQSGIQGLAFSRSGDTAAIYSTGVCFLWAMNEASGRPPIAAAPRQPAAPLLRWTEGKIRDVAVGGGGRYLALLLADCARSPSST